MTETSLREQIERIAADAGATAVAVALHDYAHATGWTLNAERWFHAASTVKIPVLLAVFDAVADGLLELQSRIHVRNRFLSVYDGSPYRLAAARDANSAVHEARGKMLPVEELARHMITTSSNLATNLLVDVLGPERVRATLRRLELGGMEFVRGVEDEAAWEAGVNNRVTARGLAQALRAIEEGRAISEEACEHMLDILHGQEFRGGIPAGLPAETRVAHKTGEMSTVAHDAGIVYVNGGEPYVLVVLTEWEEGAGQRQGTIAAISKAVYEHVTGQADG
ncbi:MAG: serine hydrolase [Gemmatimonadota bacterium]